MSLSKRLQYKMRLEFRRLTWRLRSQPNLLIIGAQKAGTSSLFDHLSGHPEVLIAYKKEVRYFHAHYSRGNAWYRAHFAMRHNASEKKIIMEASPGYVLFPHVAQRVAQHNPDMKIIVMLRNPIHRAYSHYSMNLRRKNVDEPLSFSDAIDSEAKRLETEISLIENPVVGYSDTYSFYSYLARGRYQEQLQSWFKHFPPEQIKVIQAENFFMNTEAVYTETLQFLGLSDWQPERFEVKNYSGASANVQDKIGMNLYQQLQAYFEPYNAHLFDFLGRSYDWD